MGTTDTQLFCQVQLGARLGDEVIALIERVDGKPCPCKRGLVCPLAPVVAAAPAAETA